MSNAVVAAMPNEALWTDQSVHCTIVRLTETSISSMEFMMSERRAEQYPPYGGTRSGSTRMSGTADSND